MAKTRRQFTKKSEPQVFIRGLGTIHTIREGDWTEAGCASCQQMAAKTKQLSTPKRKQTQSLYQTGAGHWQINGLARALTGRRTPVGFPAAESYISSSVPRRLEQSFR
ncbi:hypothetical protein JOQ06_003302, partial [Pogonophryne albipinna]